MPAVVHPPSYTYTVRSSILPVSGRLDTIVKVYDSMLVLLLKSTPGAPVAFGYCALIYSSVSSSIPLDSSVGTPAPPGIVCAIS